MDKLYVYLKHFSLHTSINENDARLLRQSHIMAERRVQMMEIILHVSSIYTFHRHFDLLKTIGKATYGTNATSRLCLKLIDTYNDVTYCLIQYFTYKICLVTYILYIQA